MSQVSQGKTLMLQGRIVWGSDLFKGQVKVDDQTKRPILDDAGNPVIEYGFGLAVPKANVGEIWQAIHEEAYAIYPSRQLPPDFAMKFKDGDTIDHNGQPFAEREGYAGCLVFACTTRIPIKWFKFEGGQNFQVSEGIKCGDYVNVQLYVKAHGPIGRGKAGMYLNPNAVQLLGYGKEIVNTPSGDSIFGKAAPALPPGASATPIASGGMLVPPTQAGYQQQAPMAPKAAPAMLAYGQPPVAPQAAPTPHYGVLPQQFQQQAPAAPAMPAYGQPGVAPQAAPAMSAYGQPGVAPQGIPTPGFPAMPGYQG